MAAQKNTLPLPPQVLNNIPQWVIAQYGPVIVRLEKEGLPHITSNNAPVVAKPARRRKSRQSRTQVVTTTPIYFTFEALDIQFSEAVEKLPGKRRGRGRPHSRRGHGPTAQVRWKFNSGYRRCHRRTSLFRSNFEKLIELNKWERELERIREAELKELYRSHGF